MASTRPIWRPIGFLLASTVLALTLLSFSHVGVVAAHAPHAGIDFSIGIDINGDTIDDCNTSGGPTTCAIPIGQTFKLKLYLNSFGDLPSYATYDAYLEYTSIGSKDNPDPHLWPDCVFDAYAPVIPGRVAWGCVIGVAPAQPSTYTGVIGTTDFNCTQDGTISMVLGIAFTQIVDFGVQAHSEGSGSRETLTIDCQTAPPPIGGISRDIRATTQTLAEPSHSLARWTWPVLATFAAIAATAFAAGMRAYERKHARR